MSDTHVLVVHDPAPDISASRRVLRRLLGKTPPVIRQGNMRKPLQGEALRQEVARGAPDGVVIVRNAEITPNGPQANGTISVVAVSNPVLMTLRAYEHLAEVRLKKEGTEATPAAIDARLKQMLTDAKARYPFASPQAGLYSTEGEKLPRAKPLHARDAAAIAKSVDEKAIVLFTDFPTAMARGLQMAAEAAGLNWEPALVARASKAAASEDVLKELRAWRKRLGPELFQRVCDVSRADLALMTHLFGDWKAKAGLKPEEATTIEETMAACAKVTARRKSLAQPGPAQKAA